MTGPIVVSREFALPPSIVWEALVDPVLLEGWLGAVRVDDGAVGIEWLDPHHAAPFAGRLAVLTPGRGAMLRGPESSLSVVLDPVAGGPRGESSRVSIAVDEPGGVDAVASAHWAAHLEALWDLLRGHPVDWERWDLDYGPWTAARLAPPGSGSAR